jgi:hypothetical protein
MKTYGGADVYFSLLVLPVWSTGLICQFLDHFTDGRTPWTDDQLVARALPVHRTTKTQKNTHQTFYRDRLVDV